MVSMWSAPADIVGGWDGRVSQWRHADIRGKVAPAKGGNRRPMRQRH